MGADGVFTYFADDGFAGTDSFTARITDNAGGADTLTVSIDVALINFERTTTADDQFIGNGLTRITYEDATTEGVFGDLNAGIIRGGEQVGRDNVSGVFEVRGTGQRDFLFGRDATQSVAHTELLDAFESFEGMGGDDLIVGRGGLDRASYSQSTQGVEVNLFAGLSLNDGFGGIDTLFDIEGLRGSKFDDVLTGDDGDNFFEAHRGSDQVDGRGGIDLILYADARGAVAVDLRGGQATHANGDVDTLISIENAETGHGDDALIGTGGVNELAGGAGADHIMGLAGDDELFGGAGQDQLFGQSGNDRLEGGAGDDILNGGFGADIMIGGAGNDTFIIDNAGDVIIDVEGGDTVQTLISLTLATGLENATIKGSDNLDALGNGAGNVLIGNDGANKLFGYGGADIIRGEGGNDKLSGGSNDDQLFGGAGRDAIYANSGSDLIVGGEGKDLLVGGAGVDTFQFNRGDGFDTVKNFELGVDKVDVSDFGLENFAELELLFRDYFGRANIRLDGTDDLVRFIGVTSDQLTEDDFIL